ncbi:helix-turn-helix protein [compost metagenome]
MIIRKGFSKRGLAAVAKIGEATAIQISSGDRNPSPATAKRICEALECSFDDIFVIEKLPQAAAK